MKILSASQIRELDAYTIQYEPIDSVDLMERASRAFVNWFAEKFEKNKKVKIFCGPGNNGGDGLAVARLLLKKSYHVETFIISTDIYSPDFKVNLQRLSEIKDVHTLKSDKDLPAILPGEIVIDAIFGSGLSRPVEGIYAEVIKTINNSKATIVSIDIASGLFTDHYNQDSVIVHPDYTISFQLPKLSFLLPQNENYVGEWLLADISLDQSFIENAYTNYFFIDDEHIRKILKPRNKFSHKGNFGKALIIGGSYGMMGAVVLASKACLRTGVGLCVSYIPKCGYEILQTSVPENMVLTDKESNYISEIPDLNSYQAIGVGPGLGKNTKTVDAIKSLLEKTTVPLVIDADALNIISENRELIKKIPKGSILTPHPKEFERLVGKTSNDYERLDSLRKFSKEINSIVVLKGAHTAVCSPEGNIFFNSTGNPGMATGGSGDVLTGIITSLIAQGYNSLEAATLGVYLHGFAGDVAAISMSEPAMIASDIIDGISEFFKEF